MICLTHTAQSSLTNLKTEIMSGLTSAGAILDLIVEKLGDEDQVCEDVEHHCDDLRCRKRKSQLRQKNLNTNKQHL